MTGPLDGKVALVVGGSQGVGRAYALGLAQAGAHVVAAARKLRPAEAGGPSLSEVVETGRAQGLSISASGCDISRTAEIERLVDETLINFGKIDVLLINAVWANFSKPLDVPDEAWEMGMQLNIRAPYNFIRCVAPSMIERKSGSIICMSTRAALPIPVTDPAHRGLLAYGVTKAGLARIASYFAEELKPHGIAVNSLSPGQVNVLAGGETPTPEQFAPPIVYLAQQSAQTVTGGWFNTTDWGDSWKPGEAA
jgi:NAD(P)-dependent dehydrogenase (short-subunit alcohol dehydrogenase family)